MIGCMVIALGFLQDGFGPQAHPPLGFASHTEGLYRRKALASREMFGRGSPRAKLGDFAMQLATFFGLAFPVQGDMMFLPFKVSEQGEIMLKIIDCVCLCVITLFLCSPLYS